MESKNIVVVGGSSGIGASSVKALIIEGCNVFNVSRSASTELGVVNVSLDVTSDFKEIEGLPDVVDGLVYCPGSINLKPFQSLKVSDFTLDFEINVLGAVKVIKAVQKKLRASKAASIVLFSTVAVEQGMGFHSSVAASKGAVEGLSKSLAAEFAKSNIRVNTIAPSLTNTPMAAGLLGSEDKIKASEDRHPLKAIGQPDDLAQAVKYLLSDSTKWMTGQILRLDGGMSSIRTF